jgi:hypothetical protein
MEGGQEFSFDVLYVVTLSRDQVTFSSRVGFQNLKMRSGPDITVEVTLGYHHNQEP